MAPGFIRHIGIAGAYGEQDTGLPGRFGFPIESAQFGLDVQVVDIGVIGAFTVEGVFHCGNACGIVGNQVKAAAFEHMLH